MEVKITIEDFLALLDCRVGMLRESVNRAINLPLGNYHNKRAAEKVKQTGANLIILIEELMKEVG